jgi:hypothetical protein
MTLDEIFHKREKIINLDIMHINGKILQEKIHKKISKNYILFVLKTFFLN